MIFNKFNLFFAIKVDNFDQFQYLFREFCKNIFDFRLFDENIYKNSVKSAFCSD